MKHIPIGLEVLRMIDYNQKRESWTKELWGGLTDLIDGCSESIGGCENCNGCKGECHRRFTVDVNTNPRRWGFNEKANTKAVGKYKESSPYELPQIHIAQNSINRMPLRM